MTMSDISRDGGSMYFDRSSQRAAREKDHLITGITMVTSMPMSSQEIQAGG